MSQSKASLEQIFESNLHTLAVAQQLTTVKAYRVAARRFLCYLQEAFPHLRRFEQLRRDPHLSGWFRYLCQHDPPLRNKTRRMYLILLCRLLEDLAAAGHHIQPGLIRREDIPVRDQDLPKPLPVDDDQRLQQEQRRTDDLLSNALLLTRFTGIRIGECIHLLLDCLRQVGPDQWALHVPLGKLHTERLVPVDAEVLGIIQRILSLRSLALPEHLARSEGFLLPRGGPWGAYHRLYDTLAQAAARADCSAHVTPHRLRQLCHRDAPSRSQSACSQPTAGTQRHRHDHALSPGHPTGPAARVPPGTPERTALGAGAFCSRTHPHRRSSLHSSSPGSHTPPPGDVPAQPTVRQ